LAPQAKTWIVASHLCYASHADDQMAAIVKVHGGFFVLMREIGILTDMQFRRAYGGDSRPSRYAIHAGRTYRKEFRYLRSVIVTAAVYRGFGNELCLRLTSCVNLPAPGRRQCVYVGLEYALAKPVFLLNVA